MRRSSSLMSEKSLQMCTERLGSETGSDDFSDDDKRERAFSPSSSEAEVEEEEVVEEEEALETGNGTPKEMWSANYHCSVGRRSSSHPPRSFPPPLSSISRRDGSCLHMRPHRRDGRLVMEAVPVPVPSHNYLHARRHNGRLLLAFVDSSSPYQPPKPVEPVVEPLAEEVEEEEADDDVEYEDEEEEEEEEVVDWGTVVEVKVSTQPQHRSSLAINKLVGDAPLTKQNRWAQPPQRIRRGRNGRRRRRRPLRRRLWRQQARRRRRLRQWGSGRPARRRSCCSRRSGGTERRCCTTCGAAASSDDPSSSGNPAALPHPRSSQTPSSQSP